MRRGASVGPGAGAGAGGGGGIRVRKSLVAAVALALMLCGIVLVRSNGSFNEPYVAGSRLPPPADPSTLAPVDFDVEVVRESEPAVKMAEEFLTPEECEAIIELAKPKFKRSQVAAGANGQSKANSVRTSEGCWLDKDDTHPAIRKFVTRVEAISGIPRSHGEALQVLKYEIGQQYKTHPDYFDPKIYGQAFGLKERGQRAATALCYLNTVPKGGGTAFPRRDLEIDPIQGRAIMWRNTHLNGSLDPWSHHAGLPIIEGQKFVIVQWLRERP